MNVDGIIIASTDPNRIGENHYGAQRVLKTKHSFIMDEEMASQYENVIAGISLPIFFRGQVIGVVGIGAGDIAEIIGKMVESTAELLVEQEYLRERQSAQKHEYRNFLARLLMEPWGENEEYLRNLARLHDLDLDQSFRLILFDISLNQDEKSAPEDYSMTIENRINEMEKRYEHLHLKALYIPVNLIILLPESKNKRDETDYARLADEIRERLGGDYRACISGRAESADHLHDVYQKAKEALNISSQSPFQEKTLFADLFLAAGVVLKAPARERQSLWERVLNPLLAEDEKNPIWLSTLTTYFHNDCKINETADDLFVHRNTLKYRLGHIAKITGYDPRNIRDSYILITALICYGNR